MFESGARPHPSHELYQAYLLQNHVFNGDENHVLTRKEKLELTYSKRKWRKKSVCVWLTLSGCGKFIAKDKWYGGGRWKMLIRGKRGVLATRPVSLPFCRKNSVSSRACRRITIPLHPAKPKTQNDSQNGFYPPVTFECPRSKGLPLRPRHFAMVAMLK